MKIKTLIAIVLCTGVSLASYTQSCKYWCKLDHENVYYCCPSGNHPRGPEAWLVHSMWPIMSSPIFWMGVIGTSLGIYAHNEMSMSKKKLCPPMRSACPRSFVWYDPPHYCNKDDDCDPTKKCCYDICLEHKTCKPAE